MAESQVIPGAWRAETKRSMALVNPKAGTYAAQNEFLPLVEEAGGVIRPLNGAAALTDALHEADEAGYERIIIVGGDGSVSHTVNALQQTGGNFEIGLVPAGTGNDMARSLGIPVADLATAWQLALHGTAAPVDVVRLASSQQVFINAITAGFGGQQATDVDREQKGHWGKLAYWLTALSKMGGMPDFQVELVTDDAAHQLTVLGFWIANGRTVGGGFTVAPTALVDDGLLDVVLIPSLGTLDLLSAGVDYALIGPEQSEQIVTLRARSVRVVSTPPIPMSVDGEPLQAEQLECSVVPAALRMVTGGVEPAMRAAER
jgi:diacylglycerol kinase (ATP)